MLHAKHFHDAARHAEYDGRVQQSEPVECDLRDAARLQHAEALAEGFLRVEILTETDAIAMAEIMDRYADQHFQLADVSLMHLADRNQISTVFTLDRRDFRVFQTKQGIALDLIPEM